VSVVAEGKPLREYEIKERWEDKVKTYSCSEYKRLASEDAECSLSKRSTSH
jgi:hypothetical protein